MDWLATLAAYKEWGLILLMLFTVYLTNKSLVKSIEKRDHETTERESKVLSVLLKFSDSIPQLATAIKELRSYLEERFKDVDEDLDNLQRTHTQIEQTLDDHEKRIGVLEERDDG